MFAKIHVGVQAVREELARRASVTSAAGPSWASTSSSAAWMSSIQSGWKRFSLSVSPSLPRYRMNTSPSRSRYGIGHDSGQDYRLMGTPDAAARRARRAPNCAEHAIAVVLGSGWHAAADAVRRITLHRPDGRSTRIRTAGRRGSRRDDPLRGRGRHTGPRPPRPHPRLRGPRLSSVVHPVRTAIAAGATTVILTNAAGRNPRGLHRRHSPS